MAQRNSQNSPGRATGVRCYGRGRCVSCTKHPEEVECGTFYSFVPDDSLTATSRQLQLTVPMSALEFSERIRAAFLSARAARLPKWVPGSAGNYQVCYGLAPWIPGLIVASSGFVHDRVSMDTDPIGKGRKSLS
ncbi:hypothetical protein RRG08_037567 [Elysia crispata]|uniref:Uncharacterized protein n=1 Tax=Elysia crispata TaxID=231223 RepID=A0AAE1CTC1_9GAST|nr:hypothetical protein RRG08_037567 [Elysia crispata]